MKRRKNFFCVFVFFWLNLTTCFAAVFDSIPIFRNSSLAIQIRVDDLIRQLTLEEKVSLLGYNSQAIKRLRIPAYNWWNEGLHGVARAGNAAIFPQAIGMSASFNDLLLKECATAISTEARAKYNLDVQQDHHLQYMGLTFWSPNINIFRDPRWGRGQETYGEDPFLTGAMGTAYVQGMQGNDPEHLKTAACAKHFAVHSGPESERHGFNAVIDEKDLRETYLYAFKKLVDAGVESVMCAYNRVNNEPCCTGTTLLQNILRNEWKFTGHVVTDCYALEDIWTRHKSFPNSVEVAAAAIKAGVNLDCSNLLQDDVIKAIHGNLLTEQEVDKALAGILKTEMKLGFYDDSVSSPYTTYGNDSIDNSYHIMLTRKMAAQSMVLLKNDQHILPLDKKKYQAYMVVGPNATATDALLGSYHGVNTKTVNFLEGITGALGNASRVEYDMGCDYRDTSKFGGIWAAGNADITIAVIGLTPVYEGEEGDAFLAAGGGDRKDLSLPKAHIAYIKALRKGTKTPLIAIITGGSAFDISSIEPYVDAIILAWYPGQEGGNALADLLFGELSPSGHLPITMYNSVSDLPSYNSYDMRGRTYRYFNGNVQFPFGYGLSYTEFAYSWVNNPKIVSDSMIFNLNIKNTGNMDADEVVQVYVRYPPFARMPIKELKAFRRLHILKGETTSTTFKLAVQELKKWDLVKQQWYLYPGNYKFVAGNNAADEKISTSIRLGVAQNK